jgi:Gpi18-like mannosyltransferase
MRERLAAILARSHIPILIVITLISWGGVALPLREDLTALYRYWDGPMYITVAKTFYRIPLNNPIGGAYKWPPERFAPFLLGYPVAIRAVAPLLGYHWGSVALSVLFSAAACVVFYLLLRELGLSDRPLWLSVVFLFVPYRWLVYRSVSASEPMFMALTLLSLLLFCKQRVALSFWAAALACATRIQGICLIPTYGLLVLMDRERSLRSKAQLLLGISLIPALLVLNGLLHYQAFGNWLAYLSANEEMISLIPFTQFVKFFDDADLWKWYFGTPLYLLLYTITLVGLARLWSLDKRKVVFTYSLTVFVLLAFVTHEDLARYLIPIAPFTWVVGFKEIWEDARLRLVLPVGLILTYLYAWQLIPRNGAASFVVQDLLKWAP